MALPNRSNRKVLVRMIGVGLAAIVLVLLLQALVSGKKTVADFQESGGGKAPLPKLGWIVAPDQGRLAKAKTLSYEGRHSRYLSEALIDLFGFASSCQEDGASDVRPSVVILLHSSPSRVGTRSKIRETWASKDECRKHGVVVRFTMESPIYDDEVELVRGESRKYGDILVGNFSDHVRSATMKSLLGLRWTIAFCSKVDYVIEASDRTFLWLDKLPRVLNAFRKEQNQKMIIGARTSSSRVIHDDSNPYHVENGILNREFYPPYCSLQAGVMMPFDLAETHYKYAWSAQALVAFADAFLGLNAEEYGWEVKQCHAFTLRQLQPDDACPLSDRFSAQAPANFYKIPSIWNQLHDVSYMKDCDDPDLDIIHAGQPTDNEAYFNTVLQTIKKSPGVTCEHQEVFMVALISSHPERRNARDTIRETWASKGFITSLLKPVKIFFLIGQPDPSKPALRLALDEEHEETQDLLEGNFRDSFGNLTLKHMFGLKWAASHCGKAKYFFKGDDDVFVNLANIVALLQEMNNREDGLRELYLGDGGREYRNKDKNDKYYVASEEYRGRVFPRYCVGGGYVLSMDLVTKILQEALRTPIISGRDDVFVGILLKKLEIPLVYNEGFHYGKGPTDTCSLRDKDFMVMHVHDNPDELKLIWRNFVKIGVQC